MALLSVLALSNRSPIEPAEVFDYGYIVIIHVYDSWDYAAIIFEMFTNGYAN
ncbi:MAG: hypothetical protein ACJ71L_02485 [Nitrososphaeraceae archaeon]